MKFKVDKLRLCLVFFLVLTALLVVSAATTGDYNSSDFSSGTFGNNMTHDGTYLRLDNSSSYLRAFPTNRSETGWFNMSDNVFLLQADAYIEDVGPYGYHGLYNGNARLTTNGIIGNAGYFNGTYARMGVHGEALTSIEDEITISVWINFTKKDATDYVYYDYNHVHVGYDLTSGAVDNEMSTRVLTWAGWNYCDSDYNPSLGEFFHYAVSYNSSTGECTTWINGVITNISYTQGGVFNRSTPESIQIGALADTGDFKGTIDELAVYNSSLDQSQIDVLYNSGSGYAHSGSEEGLVSAWHFDDESSINETSGMEYSWYYGGGVAASDGKIGGALSFDNHDTYLRTYDLAQLDSNYSVMYWVSSQTPFPWGLTYKYVLSANSSEYRQKIFGYGISSAIDYYNGVNWVYGQLSGAANDNSWHHHAYIFEGRTGYFYLDGILVREFPTLDEPLQGRMYVGSGWTGTGNFHGKVDELAIFNRSLNSSEISLIYNHQNGDYPINQVSSFTSRIIDATISTTWRYIKIIGNAFSSFFDITNEQRSFEDINTTGLLLHYRMNETSSGQLHEMSGRTNNSQLYVAGDSFVFQKYNKGVRGVLRSELPMEDDYTGGSLVYNGSGYLLFYGGRDSAPVDTYGIALAYSENLINWTPLNDNDFIMKNNPESYDHDYLYSPRGPSVIYNGTGYQMWYMGYYGSYGILYATSLDGISWTKQNKGLRVLSKGTNGKFDDRYAGYPSVIHNGTDYLMWYSGEDGSTWIGIGFATSPDGISWTKQNDGDPVVGLGTGADFDGVRALMPSVIHNGTDYVMAYAGYDGSNYQIGIATSQNGLNWTKQNSVTPAVPKGTGLAFDSNYVYFPGLFYNSSLGGYKMVYGGAKVTPDEEYVGYANSSDGISWTKQNDGNFVFGRGSVPDDQYAISPSVINISGTYYMYYACDGYSINRSICYATSSDKITWKRNYPDNRVLTPGEYGVTYDDYYIEEPSVVFNGTDYLMFYAGNDNSRFRIFLATSPDGISWTKQNNGSYVLNINGGKFDAANVEDPSVIYNGTGYQMWYSAGNTAGLGYATSMNGINWTKQNDGDPVIEKSSNPDDFDATYISSPSVTYNGSQYRMVYQGYNDAWRIGMAVSEDGISWTKVSNMPIVSLGGADTTDSGQVYNPFLLREGEDYSLFYTASAGYDIFYSKSIPIYEQTRFGNSLNFNKATFIDTNESELTGFDLEDSFSLEAWIKTNGTDQLTILSTMDSTLGYAGYFLRMEDYYEQGVLRFMLRTGTSNYLDLYGDIRVNDNNWHHVVVTYNGTPNYHGAKMYVDGARDILGWTATELVGSMDVGQSLLIGASHKGNGPDQNIQQWEFEGHINEVMVWNRSLSAEEVLTHYNRYAQSTNLSIRTCDDAVCSSPGSWVEYGENPYGEVNFTDTQYVQYKVDMETEDSSITPKISNVIIDFADEVAPDVLGLSPGNGTIYGENQTINLSFSADDFSNALNCSTYINDAIVYNNYPVTTPSIVSNIYSSSLEGFYNYTFNCSDEDGNTNQTEYQYFYIDTQPPTIGELGYVPNHFNDVDPNVTINFSVTPVDSISNISDVIFSYSIGGSFTNKTMIDLGNGTYETNLTTDAVARNYTVFVFVNDTVGNGITSTPFVIESALDDNWIIYTDFEQVTGRYSQTKYIGDVHINNTGDFPVSFAYIADNSPYPIGGLLYNNDYYFYPPFTLSSNQTFKDTKTLTINATFASNNESRAVTITAFESGSLNSNSTTFNLISFAGGPYFDNEIDRYSSIINQSSNFSLGGILRNLGDTPGYNITYDWNVPFTTTLINGSLSFNLSELESITDGINYTYRSDLNLSIDENVFAGIYTVTLRNDGQNETGDSSDDVNVSDSVQITIYCSHTDEVCGAGCSYDINATFYDSDCSEPAPVTVFTGGGGGTASGSSGGGGGESFEDTVELLIGDELSFDLEIENKFTSTVKRDINITVDGINAKYVRFNPTEIKELGPKTTETIEVTLTAPSFFTKGEHILTFTIKGVNDANGTLNEFTQTRRIKLYIVEVTRLMADELKNESLNMIDEMNSSNMVLTDVLKLLGSINTNYDELNFEEVRNLQEDIQEIYEAAFDSKDLLETLGDGIEEAERNGIDVSGSKRLFYVAEVAYNRGDYMLALERLEEAKLTFALETKGEFNLIYAVKNNPLESLGIIALASLFGIASSYVVLRGLYKRKLKILDEEEKLLIELMKVIQRETFEKNHLSMDEYEAALNQYELRLSETIEDKIQTQTKLDNLMTFKGKDQVLRKEKKKLIQLIKKTQSDYLTKGVTETRVYENTMKTYTSKLGDVEEEITYHEAQVELDKGKWYHRMFKRGKKVGGDKK